MMILSMSSRSFTAPRTVIANSKHSRERSEDGFIPRAATSALHFAPLNRAYSLLVRLRRDGFDLDFDARTGKFFDDQQRGRRIMAAHDLPA